MKKFAAQSFSMFVLVPQRKLLYFCIRNWANYRDLGCPSTLYIFVSLFISKTWLNEK